MITSHSGRVRVLEEALDVHAEELGLGGQGHLLADLARLRGEGAMLREHSTQAQDRLHAAGGWCAFVC